MIIIGSDHTGIELKNTLIDYMKKKKIEYYNIITDEGKADDDYPDIAYKICEKVLEKNNNLGIAICGTGIGISIACNKVEGIRAALCTDEYMAQMSKRHNNANVICLGSRLEVFKNKNNAINIVDSFINNFYEGGRHDRRLQKIRNIEKLGKSTGDESYI